MFKEALAGWGGEEGGSCSYPFHGDLHLSDGCRHLRKEQGLRGQGLESPPLHPRSQSPLAPGWELPSPSLGQCMPWLLRPDSLSQRSGFKKGPLTLAGLQVGVGGLAESTNLQCPSHNPVPSHEAAVPAHRPMLGGVVVPLSDSVKGPTEPRGHLGSQPPLSQ